MTQKRQVIRQEKDWCKICTNGVIGGTAGKTCWVHSDILFQLSKYYQGGKNGEIGEFTELCKSTCQENRR